MTSSEIRYLNTLYGTALDDFFISFDKQDISDSENLISQIKFSPHPLVLLAFIEASSYSSDENCTPFYWLNLPIRSNVLRIFDGYNGVLPKKIYLESDNGFCDIDSDGNVYLWEGVQKAIFNTTTFELTYTKYMVKASDLPDTYWGYGKIEVDSNLHFCKGTPS